MDTVDKNFTSPERDWPRNTHELSRIEPINVATISQSDGLGSKLGASIFAGTRAALLEEEESLTNLLPFVDFSDINGVVLDQKINDAEWDQPPKMKQKLPVHQREMRNPINPRHEHCYCGGQAAVETSHKKDARQVVSPAKPYFPSK